VCSSDLKDGFFRGGNLFSKSEWTCLQHRLAVVLLAV
jgi:hypothetical protein